MPGGLAGSTHAARPRSRWTALASGLSAVALVACGGSQPVARGYGSTELEPIRDSTISLSGETSPGVLAYSTGGGASGTPKVWWTIDATTGAVQSDGDTMPTPLSYTRVITPPPSPFTCNYTYLFGQPFTLLVADNTTNVDTYVPDVIAAASCPGVDGMLTVFVQDASGGIVLETGPYTQLESVELTVGVLAVVSWDGATATSPPTSVTVLAAPVTAPDQQELDSIDLTTGYYDVTPVVPAVAASAAWATGATPVGSLESTTLAGSASTVQALDGHYLYPRKMSDGGTTLFVGPITSGAASELALFETPLGTPLPTGARLAFSSGGAVLPNHYLLSWPVQAGFLVGSTITVWDDTDLAVATCPSATGVEMQGVWSSDESKVLFAVPQGYDYTGSGPLDLLTLAAPGGTASCQQLVGSGVVAAAFSPDAQFLYWLVPASNGESQLWIAASDGSGARMVGSGAIASTHFIPEGRAWLELTLDGELDWLDLHDPSQALHHVAAEVHGIVDLTGPWLVMDYRWSAADGTGTLALVNRDDLSVRQISPSVAQFGVDLEELGADGGLVDWFADAGVGSEFLAYYLVRGRNPSAQDGIWRATITPSELQ
jgi:hypothetical protein